MDYRELLPEIKDITIRQALEHAIEDHLLTAMRHAAYFGHFSVTSDGGHFGSQNTWPGLDSWEMAGAFLLLGKTQEVLSYFDYVRASQRDDGNVPFAIVPEDDVRLPEQRADCFQGFRYPDDIFTYQQPDKGYPERQWIGLFFHWKPENPLSLLAPVSYILTGAEIFAATGDGAWLKEQLPSLDRAGRYLLAQKSHNGLISGAGFYTEVPPRHQWDGVAQCYCYKVFGDMACLYGAIGAQDEANFWHAEAKALRAAFNNQCWLYDRFAEYIHPEYGKVNWHGYTDTDWAAIAFGLATPEQAQKMWANMADDPGFWWGGLPTQTVTRPYGYREWELGQPPSFHWGNGMLYDVAAMGRVWYLEVQACLAMKQTDRIRQSAHLVAEMGLAHGGKWFERYHALPYSKVIPAGPAGYCEYAAILTRTVLTNPELFT